MFIYDGYHSFQGADRESKAHTTVEKRIEQSEDTLSRTDRIIRIFTFKEKVETALNQRVSKEHWVKGDVIPEYTKNALIGHNYYGIYEAAHGYFGTSPSRLTLGQSALLAALPNAPSYLDPYTNYKGAKARQKLVLEQMVDQGMITQAEAAYAYQQDLELVDE